MKYILLILFVSTLFSQSKYPVDTVIQSTEINILKKIGLLPISIWQRVSYNSNYFNCQFYPSCSNYCASAIKQYGMLRGMVMGSERITRCNPFAIYYHMKLNRPFYDKDGRLIDFINQNQNIETKKSPAFASHTPSTEHVIACPSLPALNPLANSLCLNISPLAETSPSSFTP